MMLSKKKVFVIMPFQEPYDSYYREIYKPTIEKIGHDVYRSDDIFTPRPIMLDIQQAIIESDIVFCEMSERSPNVFYELGLAHAVGKPVVLVSSKKDDVPFDLRHIRVILYDTSQVRWERNLSGNIVAAMDSLISTDDIWPPPLLDQLKASDLLLRRDNLGSFKDRLRNVNSLDVSCATCNDLFSTHGPLIRKKWENGCKVRILVAYNPEWNEQNHLLRALVRNHEFHMC